MTTSTRTDVEQLVAQHGGHMTPTREVAHRPEPLPECPAWCWADHHEDSVERRQAEQSCGPLHTAPRVTFAQGPDSVTVDVFWQPGCTDGSGTEPRADLVTRWKGSSGDSAPLSLWATAVRYVEALLDEEAPR